MFVFFPVAATVCNSILLYRFKAMCVCVYKFMRVFVFVRLYLGKGYRALSLLLFSNLCCSNLYLLHNF